MAALCNRAGHYIFCPVVSIYLSFFLLFSSPNLSGRRLDVDHTFHTWCGHSANLECRSEMCCTRLAGNSGRKHRHFGTIAQPCRAIPSELTHVSTIGKNMLNSNTSSTCPDNIVNFGLLMAEMRWRVWGTPANFNGFCVLAALLRTAL